MKGEAGLQSSCIEWFNLQFPKLKLLLFAVPNGGRRNKIEAANLKRQGVRAGVADLILLFQKGGHGIYGSKGTPLCGGSGTSGG